MTAITASSN